MTTSIVFLDRGTIASVNLNLDFPHHITNHDKCLADDVNDALRGHVIAVTNKVRITRAHMEANPQLKLIAVAATGYDHIDVAAARELGVTVCNVRGYSTVSVAEQACMMMLALMHRLPVYQKRVAAGGWQNSPYFSIFGIDNHDVAGKTLGILGKGGIGLTLARFAEVFNMRVLFAEHRDAVTCREGYLPFSYVLGESDVFSLHCPLNDQTRNLIGEPEINQMKPGAILLNVSRGGIVNEAALAGALKTGRLGGAGLDVASTEPPRPDNPLLDPALENFILTPHAAWGSAEAVERLAELLAGNINGFMRGQPVNVVG